MKGTRTNISINIQFETIQDLDRILYTILNELSSDLDFNHFETARASYNYALEKFTVEAMTNGNQRHTYQSRINDKKEEL